MRVLNELLLGELQTCVYNLSLHFEWGDSTKFFHVELQASVLVI